MVDHRLMEVDEFAAVARRNRAGLIGLGGGIGNPYLVNSCHSAHTSGSRQPPDSGYNKLDEGHGESVQEKDLGCSGKMPEPA